jgi:hypothetical protein
VSSRLDALGLGGIAEINMLPSSVREAVYLRLVPDALLTALSLDRHVLRAGSGSRLVRITAPDEASWARVELRAAPDDRDPALLIDIGMSAFGVPELSLVQINDPRSPRFAIDRDEDGQDTLLGTIRRNKGEERRAMAAGLAPGQVRSGLRMLGAVLEAMDGFCRLLGQEFYLLEPLFYHSAILYERRGCSYFLGRDRMGMIHDGFQPGSELHRQLDNSSPFRCQGLEHTARGRSWAIHDGVLGGPWEGIKMFRAPDAPAAICTFPDGAY